MAMVRDLGHVIDREKAKIGVFITLAEPTGPMKTEAVTAGYYETEFGKYPKIQILTIKELFEGKKPALQRRAYGYAPLARKRCFCVGPTFRLKPDRLPRTQP
jgi:hypothetical protein